MGRLGALVPLLRPHRGRVALGLLAILGSASFGLAAPLVIGSAVDAFVSAASAGSIVRYALLLIGVTLVQGVFTFTQRLVLVSVSRDVEFEFRNDYFGSLARLPLGFFQRNRIGDLMARATNDLQAVRMVCGPAIMYSANTVFTGVGALYFMVRIHPLLTLVSLGTMPLVAIATQVIGQRVHLLFERVQEQFSSLSTKAQENLAGVRVVRAYARERAQEREFAELNREYVERNRSLVRWSAVSRPLLQLLVGVGFVAVLWFGGLLVTRGELTVGQFVSFNFFLSKLIWPMIAIGWVINQIQRGTASLNRLLEIVELEPEVRDEEPTQAMGEPRGALAFRDLEFTYPGAPKPVLSDITLEVPAGQTVAVVGRTGAGKSTLLSLIPRLMNPPEGTLLVDGVDVRRLRLAELRRAVGVVPQETFLFSASLRENVALALGGATDEQLREAVRLAGLEDDLADFPDGLDTLVGERGITLSGGQKQRVALARALLGDPKVLLLDDCFSAVDTRTEETILRNLEQVFASRTVVLVSHRVSTVRNADVVIVLEEGRVAARGSHAELVSIPGLYADLHRRQQLEEELAAV
jgi:ATP-binding cassette subfamily B protein